MDVVEGILHFAQIHTLMNYAQMHAIPLRIIEHNKK